jgi:hypothetical protein
MIITQRGNSYDLTEEQLIKTLSSALDSILGDGAAQLVFKTLKAAHGVDYDHSLSSRLKAFEQSLTKTIGENASDLVFKLAVANLKKYQLPPGNDNNT